MITQQQWQDFLDGLDIEVFCQRFSSGPKAMMGNTNQDDWIGRPYTDANNVCEKVTWFNANTPGYLCLKYCFGGKNNSSTFQLTIFNDDDTVGKQSSEGTVKGRSGRRGNHFAQHGWLGYEAFDSLCNMIQEIIDG